MSYQSIGFRSTCTFCTTAKVKWIDQRTKEIATRYYHPDGYSRTGEESLDRAEWLEFFLVTALADQEREAKHGNGNGSRRRSA